MLVTPAQELRQPTLVTFVPVFLLVVILPLMSLLLLHFVPGCSKTWMVSSDYRIWMLSVTWRIEKAPFFWGRPIFQSFVSFFKLFLEGRQVGRGMFFSSFIFIFLYLLWSW